MNSIITPVADAMIRKPLLPHLQVRIQFLLRTIRKSAFDELHSLLETRKWSDNRMQMVGHDYELVQQIRGAAVMIDGIDQEICPTFVAKQIPPLPCARC